MAERHDPDLPSSQEPIGEDPPPSPAQAAGMLFAMGVVVFLIGTVVMLIFTIVIFALAG